MTSYQYRVLLQIEKLCERLKDVVKVDNVSLVWPLKSILFNLALNRISPDFYITKGSYELKRVFNLIKFKNKKVWNLKKDGPMFFENSISYKQVYHMDNEIKKIFENEYTFNIISRLKLPPIRLLSYSFLYPFEPSKRILQIDHNIIPVEHFITLDVMSKEKVLYKTTTTELLNQNILGEKEYRYIMLKALPEAIRWYVTWEKIMKTFRNAPFLFLINEYSPFPYFGVVWAKKFGIPSIALQHGVIHPTHPGYYHDPENVTVNPDDYINHVIPTLTLVQGEYERRLLLKMGYPKKAIRVTGQPRYDFLAYSDEIFNRDKIIGEYGLPRNRRFIIWTTQTHGLSKQENIKNVQEILRAMKVLKDKYHLIIKLHPGENQKAPLYKKYFGDKDFATIIDGKANTYELIYISDALITKHSTTGIEAIAMGKPILLTEFIKSVDLSLYIDYGFDYILRSYQDIVNYVHLINNGDLIQDFEKKRKFFLRERLANFGHATAKVVKILDKFL